MTRCRVLGAQCSVLGALCLVLVARPAASADLTGADALVRVYDAILDARFDAAEAELARACPPAPREACDVLAATAIWWRILIDPESRALDNTFNAQTERAIKATEAWVAREPDNAEAHFYAGGAYAARVQWRVLRAEKIAAARDGKRIKQALERAIALDPELDDAYFGVGLYQYYADVAPTAAKMLRFLLLLPGGDKGEGLAQMKRTHAGGRLLKGEADYQLQIIYLWYEKRADLAADLLESLHDRYPGNPLFLAELAQLQDTYQHDITASLATWRTLLAAAKAGRVNEARVAEVRARLAIAHQLEELYQTDLALEELRALLTAKPISPAGSMSAAYLALGEGEDRLGHRDAAVAAYRLAVSHSPAPDPQQIGKRASERLRKVPDPVRAEAYRLSLDGLRQFEIGEISDAESALTKSLTRDPGNPVARYRYAHVLLARKDDAAALENLEATVRSARECPAPIAAAAYYEAARIHERLARRTKAIEYYRIASTFFGGSADTHASAKRALLRLRAAR